MAQLGTAHADELMPRNDAVQPAIDEQRAAVQTLDAAMSQHSSRCTARNDIKHRLGSYMTRTSIRGTASKGVELGFWPLRVFRKHPDLHAPTKKRYASKNIKYR